MNITNFILEIIIGLLVTGLYIVLEQQFNYIKRLYFWLLEKRTKNIYATSEFIPLHANNGYSKCEYAAINTKNYFSLEIPQKQEKILNENYGFNTFNRDDFLKNSTPIYNKLVLFIKRNYPGINNVEAFISDKAQETADDFLQALQDGKLRFNKYLLAISGFNTATKSFDLYNSDYFTFKVTVSIYNYLKQLDIKKTKSPTISIQSAEEIINIVPFLNSIGVGGFVIINKGEGDELLFSWRSSNCQSGGYWHFSYDETFTQDDQSSDGTKLSMTECIEKGLYEELGLTHKLRENAIQNNIGFVDAGIINTDGNDNRYEFEVRSFVRVSLSDKFTFEDFKLCYRFAKDAEIETEMLMPVKIKDLDKFVKNNKLSPEALSLAGKLKNLLKAGLISGDYSSFKEMKAKILA